MKNKYKLIIGLIIIVIAFAILNDWEHFKAGLLGQTPVEEIQQ